MRLEVLGVGNEVGQVDDLGEGAGGEIAGLFALGGSEGVFGGVVRRELAADVGIDGGEFLEDISCGVTVKKLRGGYTPF